jgi:hypothetical protein
MPEPSAVTANDVYRALPPELARDLHSFCKIAKENPADVIADALALHLDELSGACHDPTLVELSAAAAGGVS